VIRETFPGGEARNKWWNWVNLETADLISVDGRAFEKTALNRVVPESQMPSKNGKTIEMNTAFGASSWFWFDRKINSRIRLTFDCNRQDQLGGKETKTIIEVPAGQGQDFFYVLFPRTGNEPLPTCEKLGDGCLKIKTAESTDYVFISDNPLQFQKDGITFSGKAGAVRVSRDDIAFFMNSGSGRIGHGHEEYILEGHGPFEQAIPIRASIETGIHKVGGTEKKMQSVDIGKGITVRGEGPLQAALDHETIRIKTSGRKRVLFVTQPKFIIRPQLFIDDQEWMASWTDYPASGWGTYKNTALIGLSVPKGEHGLVVRNLKFPDGWRRQFDPTIIGVQK
ncbi:MAG: hypothetical protein QF886_17225, partial [Planctomycetota bacterium]|nr:hypothetical protein [Planctomycetota bacterium]